MNSIINNTTALWFLRQLLQFGGAWLTFKGYADADQVGQAGAAIDQLFQLAGPISFLIGFAANVFSTFRAKIQAKGHTIPLSTLASGDASMVKEIAADAKKRAPTIFESILARFGRT